MTELAAIRFGNRIPQLKTHFTDSEALAIYAALARALCHVGASDPVERDLTLHALEIMGVDISGDIDVPVLLQKDQGGGPAG
jgi:hypothetical protein